MYYPQTMVLKKSNSPINSGTTQRGVTHKGMSLLDIFGCQFPFPQPLENYVRLTAGLTDLGDDNKAHLSAFLENMYDILIWTWIVYLALSVNIK